MATAVSTEANRALSSTGAFAPANLNSSVADPLAGTRNNTAAVEPYMLVRVPQNHSVRRVGQPAPEDAAGKTDAR
jgi:hypothetical protein